MLAMHGFLHRVDARKIACNVREKRGLESVVVGCCTTEDQGRAYRSGTKGVAVPQARLEDGANARRIEGYCRDRMYIPIARSTASQ